MYFFFVKQKTAYEMRISDWSSDVCSSDLMIDTNQEILRPVIALIAWTLVMLVWLMATRLPAMKAAGVDLGKLIGGKGTDADGALPPRVQWKAHNHKDQKSTRLNSSR